MADLLEASIYLLHVAGGQSQPADPPGVAAFAAPRKAARGREKDTLFVCLGLRARAPVPGSRHAELLDLAAATFFGSAGSVTSALRLALQVVNQNLLDYNLRAASTEGGLPAQGGLICAALRGSALYAVQCGVGMLLVAHAQAVERFSAAVTRPLGLSNQLEVQYFHTAVQEGEYLCLSYQAPTGWDEAVLAGLGGLPTAAAVVNRLKAAAGSDFAALVGRFEPGGAVPVHPAVRAAPAVSENLAATLKSATALIQARSGDQSLPAADLPPAAPAIVPVVPLVEAALPLPGTEASAAEAVAPAVNATPVESPVPPPARPEAAPPPAVTVATDWPTLLRRAEKLDQSEPPPHIPIIEEIQLAAPGPAKRRSRPGLALLTRLQEYGRPLVRALGVTFSETALSVRRLLARMLPEGMLQKDGLFEVPPPVMFGLVVTIALLVVGASLLLYYQRGRGEQYDQAQAAALVEIDAGEKALTPVEARRHFGAALAALAVAEAIKPGDGTVAALRQRAQRQLDELDWVTRLDFQQLVAGGLGNVQLKQILLVGEDIYLLDTEGNRVIRLARSASSGYLQDLSFQCGQAKDRGELVDMVWLTGPTPQGNDALLVLLSTQELMYCAPGKDWLGGSLSATGLPFNPAAIEFYADRLYVLDPPGNEVWQYDSASGTFPQPPTHYTSQPYDLQGTIEFTIAGGEIFLLYQDGRLANCQRALTGVAATCTTSLLFSDNRPGYGPGERLADVAAPRQIVYDQPPEPALYLLDTNSSSIYQLSLKLILVRLYRPHSPLPGAITAFTFDASKRLFVAAGNNVYVADRP